MNAQWRVWCKVILLCVILMLICVAAAGGCNWLIGPCGPQQPTVAPHAGIDGPAFVRVGSLQRFARTKDCVGQAFSWFFLPAESASCYAETPDGVVFASRREGVYVLGLVATTRCEGSLQIDCQLHAFYNAEKPLPPETVIDLSGKFKSFVP